MKKWIILLLASVFAMPSWAEQFKYIKDVEVHYSAFNSTFLTAEMARNYSLKRNGYSAILNISVLDNLKQGSQRLPPIFPVTAATWSVKSANLTSVK